MRKARENISSLLLLFSTQRKTHQILLKISTVFKIAQTCARGVSISSLKVIENMLEILKNLCTTPEVIEEYFTQMVAKNIFYTIVDNQESKIQQMGIIVLRKIEIVQTKTKSWFSKMLWKSVYEMKLKFTDSLCQITNVNEMLPLCEIFPKNSKKFDLNTTIKLVSKEELKKPEFLNFSESNLVVSDNQYEIEIQKSISQVANEKKRSFSFDKLVGVEMKNLLLKLEDEHINILHLSCILNLPKIAKIVIRRGLDPNKKTEGTESLSCLEIAYHNDPQKESTLELIKLLLNKGARIEVNGDTLNLGKFGSLVLSFCSKKNYRQQDFNKIKKLDLSKCETDMLPQIIEEFESLEFLDLSENNFSNLPLFLNKLKNLKEIKLSPGNQILNEELKTGEIEEIRNFIKETYPKTLIETQKFRDVSTNIVVICTGYDKVVLKNELEKRYGEYLGAKGSILFFDWKIRDPERALSFFGRSVW